LRLRRRDPLRRASLQLSGDACYIAMDIASPADAMLTLEH